MKSKKKAPTKEPQLGLELPRWFAPRPPEPETQTTKDLPSGLIPPAKSQPTQEETPQRPEPSDNNPGQYAWKKPGMEKGDVMRPDLRKDKK